MLNTKDIVVTDILQIEAEARRMRAEAFAAGFAMLKAKLVAVFHSTNTNGKAAA